MSPVPRSPVVRFRSVDEALAGPAVTLTAAEQRRHDRLREPRDRAAYLAAHALVRACAAELLGAVPADIEILQSCAGCGSSEHGRPSVAGAPDVHVSLSHTAGWVAAMAAEAVCGIDVERVRSVAPAVGARVLSEAEQAWVGSRPDPVRAFAVLWARKEALVKAGEGSVDAAARIDVLSDSRLRDWEREDAAGAWVVV